MTQQAVVRSLQRDGFEDVDVQLLVDVLPTPNKDYPYFIHGDPALYSDHFTVALAHRLPETKAIQNADGTSHVINRVVIDFILAWVPRSGIPVDLLDIEDKLLHLARMYNLDTVTFDRWNSANSIQRLFAEGILAYDYSFSASQQLEIYRNLKTLVHNDTISLHDDMTLIRELKIKNGKIDHDIAGKDYADAVAAVVWAASGEGETDVQRLVRETMGSRRGAHAQSSHVEGEDAEGIPAPRVSRKREVRFWVNEVRSASWPTAPELPVPSQLEGVQVEPGSGSRVR